MLYFSCFHKKQSYSYQKFSNFESCVILMEQKKLYKEVGENIRFYRKLRHMTQKELGDKLFKSMACISKYESGTQALDLYTIYKIADILHISPSMLLPDRAVEDTSVSSQLIDLPHFLQKIPLFIYTVRSSRNEVMTCVLDIQSDSQQAIIYFGVKDANNFKDCEYILFGTVAVYETNIRIYCSNPLLKGDFALLCIRVADLLTDMPTAFMVSLSTSYKFRSAKCIINPNPLPNPQALLERLSFDKSEVNDIKKQHYLSF